ncbi:NAD(P)/FAD-dependent oxidoreductase [Labrys wisconsinensis]|uniref:Flavoprotein involved in K+ transport n=1 Tax=Labrys wisconsinensis TaxID=425677 RepID=A0ABU0JIG9_9HYPH|nr:NAD(P)/FAD-dependent oxidoreductase [Labrys wisconsinensis]MDQ0474068.1 putative flavoprotein involved in K+ transport [Labrys wisconsinensis]
MVEATRQLSTWLERFGAALSARDISAIPSLFVEDGYWRDLLAFSWNLHTAEGRAGIRAFAEATLDRTGPTALAIEGEATEANGIVEGWFTFETAVARGKGHVRLRDELCWTLLTSMEELKGFEEKKGRHRAFGALHGIHRDRKSWLELRQDEEASLGREHQPYCVVVGAGQGGLALGARLRRLGVPTIILEAHERPGDSWRKRYKSLCLHDPVWYDHMPYLPFPDDWPVYSPKDKIADWLEMYARVMELNVWTSTTCRKASYDEASGEWTVEAIRAGEPVTLRPRHLVLATGMSGLPNEPDFPGMARFAGEQHHSSRHKSSEAYRGKRCVVIGSNNSAHDISADLWENGADVTMVQRSSTHIATSDALFRFGTSTLYSEAALERGITTDKADLLNASMPYGLLPQVLKPVTSAIRAHDAELYRRLEAVGFLLDFGDDDSGLFLKYMRRGSGYYIDVGASELIASGEIKLRRGEVREIVEHGVVLDDGSELPADLIVYATGYGSMNGWAARLISQAVADKVGKVWGLGSGTTKDPGPWEGEPRNMWKPTRQEGLWFHGGNLHQSRHYSQYLALQLKARMEGLPTQVYGLPEVHHLA